jgi:aminoglycoside phosphotransferase (APT) family kinase protein
MVTESRIPARSLDGSRTQQNPKLALAVKAVGVLGYALAEKLRKPVARTIDDVPISGATVTPEWLTAVLCRGVPGARVEGFTNPGGSSGSTERLALRVTYNDAGTEAGLPTELFTKAAAQVSQRLLTGGADVLHGEEHFYMTLRDRTTMEAPRGYWAKADDRSWRSIAIMEDIAATKDARFVGPTEQLNREQMIDLVRNLGVMHGQLWEDPAIGVLHTLRDYIDRTTAMVALKDRAAVGIERARHEIPERLHGQADRIYEATVRSMNISTDDMPHTLLHGDAHVGQTYVTGEGRMGYSDWHHILRGGWAYDFAYCVNSACEPQARREWERGLLEAYLERLAAHGGDAPSFDDAWLSYRQQSFWPFTAWVFTIGRAWYQPEMQPVDRCLAIIRRTAAAIDDLDSFGALGMAA